MSPVWVGQVHTRRQSSHGLFFSRPRTYLLVSFTFEKKRSKSQGVPLQFCLGARFVRRNPFVCAPSYYIPLAQKQAPLLPPFTHKSHHPHLCANRHMSGCAPFPRRLPEYTARPRACSCTLLMPYPLWDLLSSPPWFVHVRSRVSFGTVLPSRFLTVMIDLDKEIYFYLTNFY